MIDYINEHEFLVIIGTIAFNQLDFEIPKFCDEYQRNPLEFIGEIEKYSRIKRINY